MRHKPVRAFAPRLAGLAALLWTGCASAQAPPGCRETSLPIAVRGERALLTVRLDGAPARLVLDTGAQPQAILFQDALKRLHLPMNAEHAAGQGMSHGRPFPMTFARVQSLRFAGETTRVSDVPVVSGGWSEPGVDGFFNDRRLQQADLDFGAGDARLTCPGAAPPSWTQGSGVSTVRLETRVRLFATARVNGVAVRVLFDSGSPGSSMTLAAAGRTGVRVAGPPNAGEGGLGMTSPLRAWTTTLPSLVLGDETFQRPSLLVVDKPNASADMLIGFDFFATHRVWIDKAGGRLLFRANGKRWLGANPEP